MGAVEVETGPGFRVLMSESNVATHRDKFDSGEWRIIEKSNGAADLPAPVACAVPLIPLSTEAEVIGLSSASSFLPIICHVIPWPMDVLQGPHTLVNALASHFKETETHVVFLKGDPEKEERFFKNCVLHPAKDENEAARIIESLKPSVIHHHSPNRLWAVKNSKSPMVGTAHNKSSADSPEWSSPIWGEGKNVIRLGVDLEKFKPLANLRRKTFTVGIVGRIDSVKFPDSFIKALDAIPRGISVGVIGEISENSKTLYAALSKIPNVEIYGAVNRNALQVFYHSFDCLILPSATEGTPWVALEAMACGLPIIARKVGGNEETCGEAGLYFSNDSEIWAHVQRLRESQLFRENKAALARARAEEYFDEKRMFQEYRRLYSGRGLKLEEPKGEPLPETTILERPMERKPRTRKDIILCIDSFGWAFHNIAEQIKREIPRVKIAPYPSLKNPQSCGVFVAFWWDSVSKLEKFLKWDRLIVALYDQYSWDIGIEKFKHVVEIADAIVVANENLMKILEPLCGHEKLFLCEDGIDLEMFKPSPFPEKFTVGWTGNEHYKPGLKGVDLIREACAFLNAPLVIQESKNKIPHAEMREKFYSKISTYVCASSMEGTPNPVLESLACGLPVVSTNVGIVPKTIEDWKSGFIVERSARAIAGGLAKIKALGAETFRKDALKAVESFDWKLKVKNWTNLLESN